MIEITDLICSFKFLSFFNSIFIKSTSISTLSLYCREFECNYDTDQLCLVKGKILQVHLFKNEIGYTLCEYNKGISDLTFWQFFNLVSIDAQKEMLFHLDKLIEHSSS